MTKTAAQVEAAIFHEDGLFERFELQFPSNILTIYVADSFTNVIRQDVLK